MARQTKKKLRSPESKSSSISKISKGKAFFAFENTFGVWCIFCERWLLFFEIYWRHDCRKASMSQGEIFRRIVKAAVQAAWAEQAFKRLDPLHEEEESVP